MTNVAEFLNSGIVLLLIGSIIAAIGLFTWQRKDWLFKQEYLRARVMLDRKLLLIEKINGDVGRLLATATAVAVCIVKAAPDNQRKDALLKYNEEQVQWFRLYASHEALSSFYFSRELSETFRSKLYGAYEYIDVELSKYYQNPNKEQYGKVYKGLEKLRMELRSWNELVLPELYTSKY